MKKSVCVQCGKPTEFAHNYCGRDCMTAAWVSAGAIDYRPNGLPIRCWKANPPLMLEHEHGDHPTYKWPVVVEPIDGSIADRYAEDHALIYTDGVIALTLYECCYMMWHLGTGKLMHGPRWFEREEYRLAEDSRKKIVAFAVHNFGSDHRGLREVKEKDQ